MQREVPDLALKAHFSTGTRRYPRFAYQSLVLLFKLFDNVAKS